MTTETLSVEDRAIAAADQAYRSAMAPRDGDDPTDCMWAAVFAARDVYEAEVKRLNGDGAIGTVLGIAANVRDALSDAARYSARDGGDLAGYIDLDAAIGECQRAIDLLKPMVF